MTKRKYILSVVIIYLTAASALAQGGNGLAGINDATNMVTSYFDPGTKLIYAIGAVVGLIHVGGSGCFEGCRVVVRSLYLPDRCGDDSAVVLPLLTPASHAIHNQ